MGVFEVYQRTGDGFFDGNDLLNQWNSTMGNKRRRLSEFMDSPKTKEFIEALIIDESHRRKTDIGENQLLIKVKGRNTKDGRTPDKVWLNPILFIKLAMWINPAFEVQVIRFVYDSMIQYRNDAGDAYRKLASSVESLVGKNGMPRFMPNISKALNYVTFGAHESMIRNSHGDEVQQRELWRLEIKLADLIDDGFIKSYDELISYLRKKWCDKYQPNVLR